jgi:hypothetical protein
LCPLYGDRQFGSEEIHEQPSARPGLLS